MLNRFIDDLAAVVGREHVLLDDDMLESYRRDWTGRWSGAPCVVIRPGTTAELKAVLAICRSVGSPVVPQGGNTGLVGGAVPMDGAAVLSTRRLNEITDFDPDGAEITAGAGTTLEELQTFVRPAGLELGVDFAARGQATIGGMVATNAGGLRVLRYGPMADQLVGIEAVLGNGSEIRRLPGLRKESCGPDLVRLLSGSEGTLGVITRCRLKLRPVPQHTLTALLVVRSVEHAVRLGATAASSNELLSSAEFWTHDAMELVCRHLGREQPVSRGPAYLLFEWCSERMLPESLQDLVASPEIVDAAVAEPPRSARLWEFRDRISEAVSQQGVPLKVDVALPRSSIAAFLRRLETTIREHDHTAHAVVFGHIAEGNLHVNVLGELGPDDAVEDAVLRLSVEHGGSISAEHGIGRAKRDWLSLVRSEDEVALLRAIKTACDDTGYLNPGALLPTLEPASGIP